MHICHGNRSETSQRIRGDKWQGKREEGVWKDVVKVHLYLYENARMKPNSWCNEYGNDILFKNLKAINIQKWQRAQSIER